MTSTLLAIKYSRGSLQILDQLALPYESNYINVPDSFVGHSVIKSMKVRGAPAIAIVAALSLAVELEHMRSTLTSDEAVKLHITKQLEYLKTSRPTAVNLFVAANDLMSITKLTGQSSELIDAYISKAESMLENDINDNKAIGVHGAKYILQIYDKPKVLTHCNTGSLATAGWGTALGIIRQLFSTNNLGHAYCTETRPYNQGSRLTAYELVVEKIPATLVCDSMVSALILRKGVNVIIVGADRVAANGDTANKIGTYQLGIAAAYHGIEFIVAAPSTSIDLKTLSGSDIEIEERNGSELTSITGRDENKKQVKVEIAAPGINVWNPAFDVVPAKLISAIVTERGVILKKEGEDFFRIQEFLEK